MEERTKKVKEAQDAYMRAIVEGAPQEKIEQLYERYVELHNNYFGRD